MYVEPHREWKKTLSTCCVLNMSTSRARAPFISANHRLLSFVRQRAAASNSSAQTQMNNKKLKHRRSLKKDVWKKKIIESFFLYARRRCCCCLMRAGRMRIIRSKKNWIESESAGCTAHWLSIAVQEEIKCVYAFV